MYPLHKYGYWWVIDTIRSDLDLNLRCRFLCIPRIDFTTYRVNADGNTKGSAVLPFNIFVLGVQLKLPETFAVACSWMVSFSQYAVSLNKLVTTGVAMIGTGTAIVSIQPLLDPTIRLTKGFPNLKRQGGIGMWEYQPGKWISKIPAPWIHTPYLQEVVSVNGRLHYHCPVHLNPGKSRDTFMLPNAESPHGDSVYNKF